MKAVSPVFPGSKRFEINYAEGQPEYETLPVMRTDKLLVSRWQPTEEERQHLINGGDIYVYVLHFGQPLQPLMVTAQDADNALEMFAQL